MGESERDAEVEGVSTHYRAVMSSDRSHISCLGHDIEKIVA